MKEFSETWRVNQFFLSWWRKDQFRKSTHMKEIHATRNAFGMLQTFLFLPFSSHIRSTRLSQFKFLKLFCKLIQKLKRLLFRYFISIYDINLSMLHKQNKNIFSDTFLKVLLLRSLWKLNCVKEYKNLFSTRRWRCHQRRSRRWKSCKTHFQDSLSRLKFFTSNQLY